MNVRRPAILLAVLVLGAAGCGTSPVRQFSGLPARATAVAWSPDGDFVAGAEPGGTVIVWDARNGKKIASATGYRRNSSYYLCSGLAFSPIARLLAFGGQDNSICLWDFSTGEMRRFEGQPR